MNRARIVIAVALVLSSTAVGILATDAPPRVVLEVQRGADGRPVPCAQDPVCHNRIHPLIEPVATAASGDEVVFETRDAVDNQIGSSAPLDGSRIHPLTGPVFVNGAGPGDVLEVTILEVAPGPDRFGWTLASPQLGLLRDVVPPALALWSLQQDVARSAQLPGVRIPNAAFPGVVTTAPGPDLLTEVLDRELEALLAGGLALPPEPTGAVPIAVCGPTGTHPGECLRTLPAREHGGNFDVKLMTPGTRLLLPCSVAGCLLSIGDVHYAQGDGEVAGSAIEMNATVRVGLRVRPGAAESLGHRPAFERVAPFPGGLEPEPRVGQYFATMGFPIKAPGELIPQHVGLPTAPGPLSYIDQAAVAQLRNLPEDLTLAARDALRQMIGYLTTTRGMTEQQAYLLASVAVDFRIGNAVDVPNPTVYAVLPLDVFDPGR